MAQNVDILILDHHLMRNQQGTTWLEALSAETGKQVYCAADFMGRKRLFLEAEMYPPMAWTLDMFGRKKIWNKKVLRFGSFG